MKESDKLIAAYFADLSKITFAAVVIKPLAEREFTPIEFTVGCGLTLIFVVLSLILGGEKT
jgi:hypothetical protein